MNIVWIAIAALGVSYLFKKSKILAILLISAFCIININRVLTVPINQSGYLQRKAVIDFINKDAKAHDFPCVAISYITSPGNDLGYRYFIYLDSLHANQPKSGSPVYTIVFPQSLVSRLDDSFGAIGLVLPNYKQYNELQVSQSCSGENQNLTDPMFGFTK